MLSVNWKHVQFVKIYMPRNFEVNLITRLGVIPLFSQFEHVCCLNLTSISYSFWNKGQKVLTFWKFDEKKGNNSKLGTQINFKIIKIYMPCNFEVNLITRLGVIPLFSSFFSSPDPKGHMRYCHHLASVELKKRENHDDLDLFANERLRTL
jgi:hypothetical protein